MQEMDLQTRSEEAIKHQVAEGAGIVKEVFKREDRDETFLEAMAAVAKIRANTVAKTIYHRFIRRY